MKVSFENFRSVHPLLTDDDDDSESDDWDDSAVHAGIVVYTPSLLLFICNKNLCDTSFKNDSLLATEFMLE